MFLLIDGSSFLFILFKYNVFFQTNSSLLQWRFLDIDIFAQFDVLLRSMAKGEFFWSMKIPNDLA